MPKVNQGRAANPRPKKKRPKKIPITPNSIEGGLKIPDRLPNVLTLSVSSWLIIWRHKKTFSYIILIYGIVYLILVLGLSPGNASSLKAEFNSINHGHLSTIYSGLGVFTSLVGTTTSSSTSSGSAYQIFILIIASLSIIWSLRQIYLGAKIRARDSYYKGMYALTQYIIIFLVIILELLPMAIGIGLYSLLINGGIATTSIEKFLSVILAIALSLLSLYLMTSSIMALYIVTLPDMTPIQALRSAKGLVKGRRWSVLRKIIFLPLLLLVVIAAVMLPFILIIPVIAAWLLYIITLIALVYIHSYLYNLYRGLINEQSPS
ncbi:MAG: hypothetical protein ACYCPS_04045 [Candidatus Saccharimonadales bacterium]